MPVIESLADLSARSLSALVADSEREGRRFARRLVDEWTSGVNRFDGPGEALFGASIGADLVAICGLNIDPYTATPGMGRVRHLYVLSTHRRLGIGRSLLDAIIEAARGRFDTLRLRTENPDAARLYEQAGFRRCPDAPDCTHVMPLTARLAAET